MSNSAIIFRRTQFNRYSLPLLMGIVEQASKNFPIYLLDSIDSLADFKKIYKRPILAYSFTTLQMMKVYEEIKEIKNRFENVYLIAGGPHATADPLGTLALGFNTVFVVINVQHVLTSVLQILFSALGIDEFRQRVDARKVFFAVFAFGGKLYVKFLF